MNKVAILLAGSGVFDGSEINEVVFTLLALSKHNIEYQCYAPNKNQYHVIDHFNNKENNDNLNGTRNILEESARIARGDVKPLNDLNIDDISSVIIPGGFGVAKNFCDYALKGSDFTIDQNIKNILIECNKQNKYIGAICISPVILAKLFSDKNPILTVGNEKNCQDCLSSLTKNYQITSSSEISIDENNRIVSTAAFMNDESLHNIYLGIEKLVKCIVSNL